MTVALHSHVTLFVASVRAPDVCFFLFSLLLLELYIAPIRARSHHKFVLFFCGLSPAGPRTPWTRALSQLTQQQASPSKKKLAKWPLLALLGSSCCWCSSPWPPPWSLLGRPRQRSTQPTWRSRAARSPWRGRARGAPPSASGRGMLALLCQPCRPRLELQP